MMIMNLQLEFTVSTLVVIPATVLLTTPAEMTDTSNEDERATYVYNDFKQTFFFLIDYSINYLVCGWLDLTLIIPD